MRHEHLIPCVLNELHWLPVKFRCEYKIATLAYRHFDGTLPSYLLASLCTYQTSCTLRSSNQKFLKIPKRNLKSDGDRSLLQLFGIRCLPVCGICPPSLTSKLSSKLSLSNRHFHRCRRIMVCVCVCVCVDYVYVCLYICVNGVC